jgi:hypothetical protein
MITRCLRPEMVAMNGVAPHHGDVIPPDVKKNFGFGPLPGGKPKFKLSRSLPYYRVDSVYC